VSFAAITPFCCFSTSVYVVVSICFVIDSFRKLLDTPSYCTYMDSPCWMYRFIFGCFISARMSNAAIFSRRWNANWYVPEWI